MIPSITAANHLAQDIHATEILGQHASSRNRETVPADQVEGAQSNLDIWKHLKHITKLDSGPKRNPSVMVQDKTKQTQLY